jgi:ubiquitin-conjugating enzyme E2 O
VRQALEYPLSPFNNAIRHYYISRGKLQEVVDHARALMDKKGEAGTSASASATVAVGSEAEEENAEMWNADAVGSLTTGAILSLKVSTM